MRCGDCDFSTVSEYEMQRHKKEQHSAVFDFVCDACGMDFISQVGCEKRPLIDNFIRSNRRSLVRTSKLGCQYVHRARIQ